MDVSVLLKCMLRKLDVKIIIGLKHFRICYGFLSEHGDEYSVSIEKQYFFDQLDEHLSSAR
jgi:hypothetical protein